MEFITIIQKYSKYVEIRILEKNFNVFSSSVIWSEIEEMFEQFMLQENCKCSEYEYELLRASKEDISKFFEFMYNYFQTYVNCFPENIRDESSKLNEEFYKLFLDKQEKFGLNKKGEYIKVPLKCFEYCEVYSLLFSQKIITDKFRIVFLKQYLESVKNSVVIGMESFYQLVTSESFRENKISSAFLERTLQFDNVDKWFAKKFENHYNPEVANTLFNCCFKGGTYYVEPIIWSLLASESYYNGEITEESLGILFDEKYRVIKIMIALLLVSYDYNKYIGKDMIEIIKLMTKPNNLDLIIALLNYSKKDELCEKFESEIYVSPDSRLNWIPSYECEEDIERLNSMVVPECRYRGIDMRFSNRDLDLISEPKISFNLWSGDVTDESTFVITETYPILLYNPISILVEEIREWFSTEKVLPFATRPLIKTLVDKN